MVEETGVQRNYVSYLEVTILAHEGVRIQFDSRFFLMELLLKRHQETCYRIHSPYPQSSASAAT